MRVSKLQRRILEVMKEDQYGDGYWWNSYSLIDVLGCHQPSLCRSLAKLEERGEVIKKKQLVDKRFRGVNERWTYEYILPCMVEAQKAIEDSKEVLTDDERLDRFFAAFKR